MIILLLAATTLLGIVITKATKEKEPLRALLWAATAVVILGLIVDRLE